MIRVHLTNRFGISPRSSRLCYGTASPSGCFISATPPSEPRSFPPFLILTFSAAALCAAPLRYDMYDIDHEGKAAAIPVLPECPPSLALWQNEGRMTCRAILLGLSLVLVSSSQMPTHRKTLRKCPKRPTDYWDNCVGSRTVAGDTYTGEFRNNSLTGQGTCVIANGDKYTGEFLEYKFNGQGTYTWAVGGTYVGEFRGSKRTGRGTYLFANGDKYVGEFQDNILTGHGTYFFSNGDVYVGEFRADKPNGAGIYTIANGTPFAFGTQQVGQFMDGKYIGPTCGDVPTSHWCIGSRSFSNGDKYFGEFHDNMINGQGTYTFANRDKYAGEFHDNTINGQGTYTWANGARQVGQFKDGKYVSPLTTPASAQGMVSTFEVSLDKQGGVLLVPVLVNNRIVLNFVIDSGASDVSIPSDVVSTLWRTGTLTESDFTGTKTYTLADGSRVPSATFRIRSLRVGDRVLENVSGSVASINGSLLLGQSFLSRFTSWSIDNARQVLVLQ